MTWRLTHHAISRFQERHAPHLDDGICASFLKIALDSATPTGEASRKGGGIWRASVEHRLLGDEPIVFLAATAPMAEGGGLVVVTILRAHEDATAFAPEAGPLPLPAEERPTAIDVAALVATLPICIRCRSEVLRAIREGQA